MTTALLTHPACLAHETPPGHPECVERLEVVLEALKEPAFSELEWIEARAASVDELQLVHPPAFVETITDLSPATGFARIDADTAMSPGSFEAALRAAGSVCQAVDMVMAGEADNAFCAVRPPGHHAEPERAMGFCLFSNVAIGAAYALAKHGLARAAVIDFDVHHGNGTQAAFWHNPGLFYASTHQAPHYPGTGYADETGAHGNVLNMPLPAGTPGDAIVGVYETQILPAVLAFAPDIIFISAGFDGHINDPLADFGLENQHYERLTRGILDVAKKCGHGRVISALEGGYNLQALADASAIHVQALMKG